MFPILPRGRCPLSCLDPSVPIRLPLVYPHLHLLVKLILDFLLAEGERERERPGSLGMVMAVGIGRKQPRNRGILQESDPNSMVMY